MLLAGSTRHLSDTPQPPRTHAPPATAAQHHIMVLRRRCARRARARARVMPDRFAPVVTLRSLRFGQSPLLRPARAAAAATVTRQACYRPGFTMRDCAPLVRRPRAAVARRVCRRAEPLAGLPRRAPRCELGPSACRAPHGAPPAPHSPLRVSHSQPKHRLRVQTHRRFAQRRAHPAVRAPPRSAVMPPAA